MVFEYVFVFILAVTAGGWAAEAGVVFGFNPFGVYLAAFTGSLLFTTVVLVLGGGARDAMLSRFIPEAAERVEGSRAKEILERWGVPGLAIVGGSVLGPTITLPAAIILGVERSRFAVWHFAATIIGFALMTVFWATVT